MDKIWDRKFFEVGGHWPLWRGWKNEWPRRTDKSWMLIFLNKIIQITSMCYTSYLNTANSLTIVWLETLSEQWLTSHQHNHFGYILFIERETDGYYLFLYFQFSNLIPDYVITGPEFGSKGQGGYQCAGFYGNQWEYRPDTAACVCWPTLYKWTMW